MLHSATIEAPGAEMIRIIKVHSSMPMPQFVDENDRKAMDGRFGDPNETIDGFINFSVSIDSSNGAWVIDKPTYTSSRLVRGTPSFTMLRLAYENDSNRV